MDSSYVPYLWYIQIPIYYLLEDTQKYHLVCKVSTKSHLLYVSDFRWINKWQPFIQTAVEWRKKSLDSTLQYLIWMPSFNTRFAGTGSLCFYENHSSHTGKESCSQLVGEKCHEIQTSSVSAFLCTLVTTIFLSEPSANKTSFNISTN